MEQREAFGGAKTCYGIDLRRDTTPSKEHGAGGEHTARPVIVRADRTRGGHINCSAVPVHDPLFIEQIREGTPAVGCIEAGKSFAHWIEAPFPSVRKARRVFHTLLDIQLPFPLENCVYRLLHVQRTAGNATRALAVGARVSDVEERLESFIELGIDPQALDQEGVAIWTQSLREFPPAADNTGQARVIVCQDSDRTTIVIGRGKEFLSAHTAQSGNPDRLTRFLRMDLGKEAGPGDQNSSQGKQQEVQWVWAGPASVHADLVAQLHGQFSKNWPGPSMVHDQPDTFLARALATRALLPGPMRCDLRTGKLMHMAVVKKARRQLARAVALLLAAGILLCGINIAVDTVAGTRESQVDVCLSKLADSLAGYQIKGARGEDAMRIVRTELAEQTKLMRPFRNAFEPSLLHTVSSIVNIGKESRLRYEIISVSRDEATIRGTARDWDNCDNLAAFLRQEGYHVTVDKKESLADETVPFAISAGVPHE